MKTTPTTTTTKMTAAYAESYLRWYNAWRYEYEAKRAAAVREKRARKETNNA